jgi:hypothetical protein
MEKSVRNAVEQIVNRELTSVCVNATFSILFVANTIFMTRCDLRYRCPHPDENTIDSAGHDSFDESAHRNDATGGFIVS